MHSAGITHNLIVSAEGFPLEHYELRARRIGIGRSPENHIILDCPSVSGAHVELHWTDRGYVLEDQLSRNGTVVNGCPVTRIVLQDGSRIQIGTSSVAHYLILPEEQEVEDTLNRSCEPSEQIRLYLELDRKLDRLNRLIETQEERLRVLRRAEIALES